MNIQSQYGSDSIRRRVFQAAQNRQRTVRAQSASPQPSTTFVPKSEQPKKRSGLGFLTVFLGTVIFLLSCATFYGMAKSSEMLEPTQIVQRPQPTQPAPIQPSYMTKAEAQAWMQNMDARLAKMEGNLSEWNHRVWLLAIASNENAILNRRVDRKYHGGGEGEYITFDGNWKINKMPETMNLDENTRQKLQGDLK